MNEQRAKIVWLEGPGILTFKSEPLDPPGSNEVLCETLVSAISPGTELAAWRGDPPLRPGNPYPRLQGYCNVARVIAAGSGQDSFKPGDLVLSQQSHRSHFATRSDDLLWKLTGTGLAPDHAASAYLFHLGYNAVLRSDMRARHRVAVIGLGALGLGAAAMAHLGGAGEVIAITDHAAPARIAQGYGAQTMGRADALGGALTQSDGLAADIVILTSNAWEDFALAQRIARRHATIACLGFPGRNQPPGDFNPLAAEFFYNKQLRIEAVGMAPVDNDSRGFNRFNLRDNMVHILGLMESGRLDPAPILSGRYQARDIVQAYKDLNARKDGAITFLLDWSGGVVG